MGRIIKITEEYNLSSQLMMYPFALFLIIFECFSASVAIFVFFLQDGFPSWLIPDVQGLPQ